MRIPKVIKVGGINHNVVYKPFKSIKDNEGKEEDYAMGLMDADSREIILEEGRTDIDWVLLHEIIHACLDCLDVRSTFKKEGDEERFVRPFSRLLFDALINAGLIHSNNALFGSNRPDPSEQKSHNQSSERYQVCEIPQTHDGCSQEDSE